MNDIATKTRTITLTGRPPVTIIETDWPVTAHGYWHDSKNGIEHDWTRRADIRVRQHADGRAIVYGTRRTKWQGERDLAAGELLTGTDTAALIAAIRRVAVAIGHDELAQETIADLPPETI